MAQEVDIWCLLISIIRSVDLLGYRTYSWWSFRIALAWHGGGRKIGGDKLGDQPPSNSAKSISRNIEAATTFSHNHPTPHLCFDSPNNISPFSWRLLICRTGSESPNVEIGRVSPPEKGSHDTKMATALSL